MSVSSSAAAGGRIPARWIVALLLLAVTTINYLDRQALAVAAPVILPLFDLSRMQYGWITSGFLIAYALGQVVSGRVVDRIGTRSGFSYAVSLWSVAAMLHAAARGFFSLFGFRFLLGLFEGANYPTALKVAAEWFPRTERALAVGIFTSGPGLGSMLAPPVIGVLILTFGWQAAFIIPGAVGYVWLLAWRYYYREPEAHRSISAAERQMILEQRAPPARGKRPRWSEFVKQRTVIGLMLSRFVGDNTHYFFIFWLPVYLANARGFDIKQISLSAWIPYVMSDIGSIFAGWLSGRLLVAGWSLDKARKTLIWGGAALVIPCVIAAAFVESPLLAIFLIGAALFCNQLKSTPLFTLPSDLYPARDVATVWGMFGAAGSFGAVLFSPVIGWVADNFSYTPVFIVVSVLPLGSAAVIALFIPRISRQDTDA
jgi:ACS family hexuronate transporter-like MFS transporter